jgi:hypothetical protein
MFIVSRLLLAYIQPILLRFVNRKFSAASFALLTIVRPLYSPTQVYFEYYYTGLYKSDSP